MLVVLGFFVITVALFEAAPAEESPGTEGAIANSQTRQRGLELFEKKIRPVLVEHCYECHAAGSDDLGGGLFVDSREGLRHGGDSGPALRPGKPGASLLVRAIEYDGMEMPPDEQLPESVARDFRRWIALGAPDPRDAVVKKTEPNEGVDAKPLWSFQPLADVAVPESNSEEWAFNDIDRFVAKKHAQNNLIPNPDADPATLLRRVYFDLAGIPPTSTQLKYFLENPSDQRYQEIVHLLLASETFAERWSRHWLDVARYGESAGSSRDVLTLYAWRYRDYVIDAFHRDIPFDQFIAEQIAGDLLDADDEEERARLTVATGLLAIGSKSLNGGNLTYDVIDDQIDVISKAVLGLTVSCARCHDHKFDAIPTRDYYALAGIFLSTETRYGGGTKRPNSEKLRQQSYLTLGAAIDPKQAAEKSKVAKQHATLQKQVRSSERRVASLAKLLPESFVENLPPETPDDFDNKQQ